MLAIPRSTPTKPSGLRERLVGHLDRGIQQPHPSRQIRSDSPRRWAASSASCRAEPVKATPFSRPALVQIDTVRASCCQDRHRSSYGWAAGDTEGDRLGFDGDRRGDPGLPRFPAARLACRLR